MSSETVLARGRALAESLMVDTCTVRRITGQATDPNTGEVVNVYDPLYTGQKCRVQSRGNWGERKVLGQAGIVELTIEVQLPVSVTGLQATTDEVVITASAHDADLVGRVFLLRDIVSKTHGTAHRFMGTEVTG